MPEKTHKDKWCPLGRLSIQRITQDKGIEVVQAGAYNQALVQVSPRDSGSKVYNSTHCCGPACAFYRRSLNPWHWGYCGITPERTGKYIVGAAVLLTMGMLAQLFWR